MCLLIYSQGEIVFKTIVHFCNDRTLILLMPSPSETVVLLMPHFLTNVTDIAWLQTGPVEFEFLFEFPLPDFFFPFPPVTTNLDATPPIPDPNALCLISIV
ncbi:unnamed protein product [Linum trigynum]|uniref:Uncharacterized protein n=1 Tax=Linum trigynum TaxID=586398 RepID=A0AAV2DNY2_9ROSI